MALPQAATPTVEEPVVASEVPAPVATTTKRPTKRVAHEAPRDETPRASEATAEAPDSQPTNAPPAPAVVEDVDGRLYARAHEAHFVQRNAAAALTAWDAYLVAQPDGRFALEAKYNRALCLVRLERLDEAKTALRPFRDGRFGSYRQVEAARLLGALERR
jgi:hypothetical protein